ncbi:t-SNARE [Scleroderma yunnanense]
MARDRLAALRAQRQDGAIELQVQTPSQAPPVGATEHNDTSAMPGFYSEITAIQDLISQFDSNITAISDLHARSLNALSDQESEKNASRLAEVTESTRTLSNDLSRRIKALQTPVRGISRNDAEIRKNRITLVHGKFIEALQRYQVVEQQYRQRYKDRVERQFKIVKKDATPEEIAAVVNNTGGSGDGIFLQAISTSNRYGESRQAYREVQERHQDIQRIEHTLGELAQLYSDMANLINQQQNQFDDIEAKAENVQLETKRGQENVGISVDHARSARRKRWICFWLAVIIVLIAVGVGVGVYYSQHSSNSSSSSSSTATVTATVAATPSASASAGSR